MSARTIDANPGSGIAELGRQALAGEDLTPEQGRRLFRLTSREDIFEVLAWANRIRERFKGRKIHLCSILNIKAGGCPEDCRFCAQSAAYETDTPRFGLVDQGALATAAREAAANGVAALGIVAAWRGLDEGPALDQVCHGLEALKSYGQVRADASLGMIRSQGVADRLAAAGLGCYNHNLETSRRFFPQVCTTHSYEDRVQTINHLKRAGIRICSGGLLGMGESQDDRCDLAFALKQLGADIVPLNFLNPIPGTPFGHREPLAPLEILKTIACFRLVLARREILIAGGRTVNLRELQSLIFMAGASALMVGNYLTTPNQPVEKDLQMLKDLGLEPSRDWPGIADRGEPLAVSPSVHAG